jgi:hypothetical protein
MLGWPEAAAAGTAQVTTVVSTASAIKSAGRGSEICTAFESVPLRKGTCFQNSGWNGFEQGGVVGQHLAVEDHALEAQLASALLVSFAVIA